MASVLDLINNAPAPVSGVGNAQTTGALEDVAPGVVDNFLSNLKGALLSTLAQTDFGRDVAATVQTQAIQQGQIVTFPWILIAFGVLVLALIGRGIVK